MASTFSPNLRFELIGNGEQAGTWGTTTNTNLGTLIEGSIAGAASVSVTTADQALSYADGAADESRVAILILTTTTTADFAIYAPPVSKLYVVANDSSYDATIYNSTSIGNTTAAGTGVLIPAGKSAAVWSDGTNFKLQTTYFSAATITTLTATTVTTTDLIANTAEIEELNEGQLAGFRNRLINGNMRVSQRNTSFTSASSVNNSGRYTLDRWFILSDGNDVIDITQNSADAPSANERCIALDVETINKKFGIAQIIESSDCVDLVGKEVTFSFKAKVSSTTKLDNVKAAILAWTGTADNLSALGGRQNFITSYNAEGTNPTFNASATYENTPTNLGVTTSWATYSVSATIDTPNTNNVMVFIWSDVTDTTLGDFLYITNCQLESGGVVTPFEYRTQAVETVACQRFFERYVQVNNAALTTLLATSATTAQGGFFFWKVRKRTAPGIGVAGAFELQTKGPTVVALATNPSIAGNTVDGFSWSVSDGALTLTPGEAVNIWQDGGANVTADAEI